MIANYLLTASLVIYIWCLSVDFQRTLDNWEIGDMIPIVKILLMAGIVSNAVFFTWTCLIIYQLLFNLQPTTYTQAVNLCTICLMELVIIHLLNGKLGQ